MSTTYQPRFLAFAKHLGKTPDALVAGCADRTARDVLNADFMAWIGAKWGEWAQATGRDRSRITIEDQESFDAFIGAPEWFGHYRAAASEAEEQAA